MTSENMNTSFELIVGPADGVIENADVPVRWCVSSELVQQMEDAGVENPYVVIATSDKDGYNEWRTVVPLGDMLVYARFYRAGEQNIYAIIIDATNDPQTIKRTERKWTQKDYGEFEAVMQRDGDFARSADDAPVHAATEASVIIPEGVFGKEPSPWVKWYVNLFHGKNKVDDQCEFRRRAILAFTLKWIPVTLWSVFYVVVSAVVLGAFALAGFTSWLGGWRHALHPWDGDFGSLISPYGGEFEDLRDSRFVFNVKWTEDGDVRHQPVWFLTMLSPFMLLLYAGIVYAFTHGNGEFWYYDWHVGTAWTAAIFTGVVAAVDLGTAAMFFIVKKAGDQSITDHQLHEYAGMGAAIALISFLIFIMIVEAPGWVSIGVFSTVAVVGAGIAGSQRAKRGLLAVADWIERGLIRIENWLMKSDANDYTEIRELLCPQDHENLSTDIKSIPKERQTWRLKFHALKQKVCKPMQR